MSHRVYYLMCNRGLTRTLQLDGRGRQKFRDVFENSMTPNDRTSELHFADHVLSRS